MKLSPRGKALIMEFEGLRLEAYRCPGNVWTIGYGHTEGVKPGHRISEHQASVLLDYDVEQSEDAVNELVPGTNQHEFDALVSFTFNVGRSHLANSTLRKRFLKGDKQAAALEFQRWVLADGVTLPGLVKRREAEKALFLEPVPEES